MGDGVSLVFRTVISLDGATWGEGHQDRSFKDRVSHLRDAMLLMRCHIKTIMRAKGVVDGVVETWYRPGKSVIKPTDRYIIASAACEPEPGAGLAER